MTSLSPNTRCVATRSGASCVLVLRGVLRASLELPCPPRLKKKIMVTLSIDFQDGFTDDTVVLKLNGKEVFRKKAVSTKLLLGKADSFKTEADTGLVNVEISVPTKDIARTFLLEVSADEYIGISIVTGKLECVLSDEPFGYA